MGKYMRKAKISGDVAVMELSQSTLGVRTRAKTRLQSSSSAATTPPSDVPDSSCYLQLRSRRLEKPSVLKPQTHQPPVSPLKDSYAPQSHTKTNLTSNSRLGVSNSVNSGGCGPITRTDGRIAENVVLDYDLGEEVSFGENNLDFEPKERSTRESTPCNLIRDGDVATPGSSTRQKAVNAVDRRIRSAILGDVPSATEIEEFFARAEQNQQQQFIEKYNFDVVNDIPLRGHYEWVRVSH